MFPHNNSPVDWVENSVWPKALSECWLKVCLNLGLSCSSPAHLYYYNGLACANSSSDNMQPNEAMFSMQMTHV